ncbi:MAG: DUF1489 family protein [Hyphomicrobium sp.]
MDKSIAGRRTTPHNVTMKKAPLHLIKLCVGAASVVDLADWQAKHRKSKTASGRACVAHTTFQAPTRQAELLGGGSLYWVIKGTILVRQLLIGFTEGAKDDGSPCCVFQLDPKLIAVRPTPRRAFQGWRYLTEEDAPSDIKGAAANAAAAMPTDMRRKLAELGLI